MPKKSLNIPCYNVLDMSGDKLTTLGADMKPVKAK